jgi:hypothetical protein
MDDILKQAQRSCLLHLSELADGKAILEPTLRSVDGTVTYDCHGLKTPIRKDVATKQGDSWVTANVDAPTVRVSPPINLIWKDSLGVSVHALTWDYVTFLLSPPASDVNWIPVRDWFLRWFDVDDVNDKIPEGLFGVIHFMSDPETEGNQIKLVVDFGSAPVGAFGELLDCFTDAGFTRCDVQ